MMSIMPCGVPNRRVKDKNGRLHDASGHSWIILAMSRIAGTALFPGEECVQRFAGGEMLVRHVFPAAENILDLEQADFGNRSL